VPQGVPYGAGPGGPSYPTPPRKKNSLIWLWVVLAVVLVVLIGAAVTLLITKPWDDDGSGGSGGGDPTSGTTRESGGPVEEGVTGDLDGDGLGDAVGRRYDDSEHRLTLTNVDGSFEVQEEPVPEEETLVVADFDGDGASDIASWFDASGALRFEVEGVEMEGVTADNLDLWFQVQAVKATVADVDGDGLTDLVAYGQTRRSQVSVWVFKNNGEGFDEPARWAKLENASYGSTTLVPGDFDGDGTDDLFAVVPNQPIPQGEFNDTYWYGDFGIRSLRSTGSTFEISSISPTDQDFSEPDWAVGDFDGDGVDTVVTDDYGTLVFHSFDGSTLRPSGQQVNYELGDDGLLDGITTSDVNGDGSDDLVFTVVNIDDYSFSGAWVVTAEGSEFDAPTQWASIPPCSGDYCEVTYFPAS
jgi:hypothetical protein